MRRFTRNLRIGCGSVEEKPNCRLRDEQSWQCGLVLDQEGASAPGERMKYFCSQYGKSGPREMTCWLREAAHSQKLKFRSRYPHDKLCLQCLPYYPRSEERRGRITGFQPIQADMSSRLRARETLCQRDQTLKEL